MEGSLFAALVFSALVASIVMIGCASDNTNTLEGKTWALESYGDPNNPTSVIKDTQVTAKFIEGEVNGNAGCNGYFGSYKTDGKNLTFGAVASTEMYCMDPKGVMDQEYAYLQALGKAERYEVKDGKLTITCTDGQVLTITEEAE